MKKSIKVLSTCAFLGLALAGMTACSSSDDDVAGSQNVTNDAKQYVAVNIQSVQSAAAAGAKAATRAKNDTYEDGTADEQKVTSIAFYFFNADGTPFRLSNNDNHNWLSFDQNDLPTFTMDDNSNNGIEAKSDVVLLLQNNTGASPASMIVVLNPTSFTTNNTINPYPLGDVNTGTLKDMSLTDLRANTLLASSAHDENGFVMSNSIYLENGTLRGATQTAGHIAASKEAAKANPVEVYVERVNAKVRAHLATASSTGVPTEKGKLGSITATMDITAEANGKTSTIVKKGETYPAYYVDNASERKVYALVLGWGLADQNGHAALEKDLGAKENWSLWDNNLGFNPWTTADYHRSFWEITPGFNSTVAGGSNNQLVNQSWNAYTTSLSTEATSLYTLPNTHQGLTGYENCDKNTEQSEFTKFLAKTVLVYNNGTDDAPDWEPAELCTYENNNYFGTTALRTKVAAEYSKYYTKSTDGTETYTALAPSDITFTTSEAAKNYQVVPCVKDGTYYTKNADGTTFASVPSTTINAEMAANVADVRNAGMTYYYYCIRHLASNPSQIGYLGVVRNHLYDVTVNSMKGFGTPVYDPDKVIIPVVPSNDATYLAAQINVLAWRIVSQTADLEATAGN